jgi:hypothetical protein
MRVSPRSGVRERGNAHLIEDVDVSPHTTGGRIRWRRRRVEGCSMRAENGIAQAVNAFRFVTSPKMIKLDVGRFDAALTQPILDFVF